MQRENGRGRRFSKEKRQERVSRDQFDEEFEEWLVNPLLDDLGEDLFVQIYDDGHSTGLSFLAQLKSTRDIQGLTLKSEPVVSYPFEVKDLEHWEDQTPPVVLVVWDVRRRGRLSQGALARHGRARPGIAHCHLQLGGRRRAKGDRSSLQAGSGPGPS